MQTLVSICKDSEKDQQMKRKSSQYRTNHPYYVDGCTYAEMCPEAAKFWQEGLKQLATGTLRIASEKAAEVKAAKDTKAGKKGKKRKAESAVRMVSSMPEGSDKAAIGTREKPAGECKRPRRG